MTRIVLLVLTTAVLGACQTSGGSVLRTTSMSSEAPHVPKTHLIVPRY